MNIISFSLWGNNPKYSKGACLNIIEAKTIYPGWECWFYCHKDVNSETLDEIQKLGGKVIIVDEPSTWNGLFWRFWALDEDADIVIVRDTDSIVNDREKQAVLEWLKSDYQIHGMRDHIEHNVPIMGGMWGCKNPKTLFSFSFKDITNNWCNKHKEQKGTDQEFLNSYVWESHRVHVLTHDRYLGRAFQLQSGEILTIDDVVFYNKWDNVELDFPRGRIEFKDRGSFQRLDVYEYDAISQFGEHEIRPFPQHEKIKYGNFVGEILNEC